MALISLRWTPTKTRVNGSLSGQSTSRRYALAAPFLGLGAGLWKSDGRAERRVDDIHYPAVFLGRWDCESVLTDVNNFETAQGDAKNSNSMATSLKDQNVYYSAKFLTKGGSVICDRGYTCRTLMEAVLGPQSVEKVFWSPSSPSVLRMELRGNLRLENRVVDDLQSDDKTADGEFLTTEYSQQVFDNVQRADGPPSVVPSLCETVYRWDNTSHEPDVIQAVQKVYIYNKVLSEQALSEMNFDNLSSILSPRSSAGSFWQNPRTAYSYSLELRKAK